jgi:uncharacterized protein (DUF1015 family)
MSTIRPFKAFRPQPTLAGEVAAKPYDVLNSDEARVEVKNHPLSFLHVGKPEVDLDLSIDLHDPRVYQQGKSNLQKLIADDVLVEDTSSSLYVYAQTMGTHTQYGLVGCASVEEYGKEIIKKHEFTRKDKEEDRCEHVRVTNAHSGPIFLTYRDNREIDSIVARVTVQAPENDHVALDGVRHQSWIIKDSATIQKIVSIFQSIPNLYIADGHHRSAAAYRVGMERAQANPHHRGDEEYNFFLAVYFPASQLRIMDYNRVVKDLNGLTTEEFFAKLKQHFTIQTANAPVHPAKKDEFGMYLGGRWYSLMAEGAIQKIIDPVDRLDVSVLQKFVLDPILGVHDPRTDKRVDFVGGIRGLGELERRVNSGEMKVAFSMFPTSLDELMASADDGKVMPPKSTWFEPKLRDGLFVHFLD